MIAVILGLLIIIASALLAEYLGRKKIIGKETSRKIPHLVISLVLASATLFIDLDVIVILILLNALAILVIYRFDLFPSARAVDRLSWGELFFPFGLVAAAIISPTKWMFIAAVLVLGVADALAALVGIRYGKHKFKIFGNTKSLEGSTAFLVSALIIISLITFVAPADLAHNGWAVMGISLVATALEAIAPWGTDNLFIPIAVVLMLRVFL
jgi:phytol kinase